MKKRILALILTVAMMVAVLPFSAVTASAAEGDGIKGTMIKVPTHSGFTDETGTWHSQSTDLNYMGPTAAGAKRMYRKFVYGESFWIAPHTLTRGASNGTADGTPVQITESTLYANTGYGSTAWASMNVAETDYVAIRLRFYNNSGTIDNSTAMFNLKVCGTTLSNNDSSPILWYDLEDNSLQRWYRTGISNNDQAYFFVQGDLNGYMLVPVANIGGASAITGSKPTIKLDIPANHASASTSGNYYTWKDKEMLIGDTLVVDKDAFVTAKKTAAGYGKYTSVAGDTGIIAHRVTAFDSALVGGFNNYLPSAMSGKYYDRVNVATAGSALHYVSLPNGDRALEFSTPVAAQGSLYAYIGSQNTYDGARTTYYTNHTTGYTTKGIPAELQSKGESVIGENDGLALRVAVTGNEGKTINVKYQPIKTNDGTGYGSALAAGKLGDSVIKFVDAKTGAISEYTLNNNGIPITGNIDGWFVVPDFSAHYWTAAGANAFHGYFGGFAACYGWRVDVAGLDTASTTQKFFMGDIQFVKDDEKYVAAHSNAAKMLPSAASLSLADDLFVNYKVNIARHEIYGLDIPTTANFTVDGFAADPVTGVIDAEGKNLVFTLTGITPQQIGDEITTVLDDGATHTYSIKTYADNMLANEASSTELKTLLADLLNYGAEAQKYADYYVDNLVNANLDQSLATAELAPVEPKTAHEALEGATHLWKSAALRLNEKVEFKFTYKMAEGATCNGGYIKATDEEGNVIGTRSFDKGSYVARFMGLNADEMRKVVKFQLFDRQNNPISGVLTYSIESYVAAKKDTAGVGTLVTAMMKYGDAAAAYGATL